MSDQEIDLGVLIDKLKQVKKAVYVFFYKILNFFISNFLILSALVVFGVLAGYLLDKQKGKELETYLIVDTAKQNLPYLYNAVELLNDKAKEEDTQFVEKYPFVEDLKDIEIEPIVDVTNILTSYKEFDEDQVLSILERVETKKDFLKAEALAYNYNYHKIKLVIPADVNQEGVVENLMNYIEDNEYLQKLRVIRYNSNIDRIKENIYTLGQIDSLLVNSNKSLSNYDKGSSQIILLGENNVNPSGLIINKTSLLAENVILERELVQLDHLIQIINTPKFIKSGSLLSKKIILFPVLLLVAFMGIVLLLKFYKRAKKYANN